MVQCKQQADLSLTPGEAALDVSAGCFSQETVTDPKGKHDACAACCGNDIGVCFTDSSRLACVARCRDRFPFDMLLAADPNEGSGGADADENVNTQEENTLNNNNNTWNLMKYEEK